MANSFPQNLNNHKKDWANDTPVKDTHPLEHNDVAGAVEELEKKVGADASNVETSHDYKLSSVTGSDKAASKDTQDTHISDTDNPHGVDKGQVGLGNVDNTSDATKNAAAATLTNKTINADNNSISDLETDNFKADVVDADGGFVANSDTRVPTQQAVKEYVDNSFVSTLPSGSITLWSTNTPPSGYLICDGAAVSRSSYSALFAVLGTTYGAGDGSTTFNLPNVKGSVPLGRDSADGDFDTLGNTGGEKEHQIIIEEMPTHSHFMTNENGSGNAPSGLADNTTSPGDESDIYTGNAGDDQPHNNLQPYLVLNYIIKT